MESKTSVLAYSNKNSCVFSVMQILYKVKKIY